MRYWKRHCRCALALGIALPLCYAQSSQVGREVAIPEHLQNGQEFQASLTTLLDFGKQLFTANWTIQEGRAAHWQKAWARQPCSLISRRWRWLNCGTRSPQPGTSPTRVRFSDFRGSLCIFETRL